LVYLDQYRPKENGRAGEVPLFLTALLHGKCYPRVLR
jgi:hypothetical protein